MHGQSSCRTPRRERTTVRPYSRHRPRPSRVTAVFCVIRSIGASVLQSVVTRIKRCSVSLQIGRLGAVDMDERVVANGQFGGDVGMAPGFGMVLQPNRPIASPLQQRPARRASRSGRKSNRTKPVWCKTLWRNMIPVLDTSRARAASAYMVLVACKVTPSSQGKL